MNTENPKETLDNAFKSADLGDKVWMFFTQNARTLLSTGIATLIILGIVIATMIGKSICQKAMKAAYLDAIQTHGRERFAQKYISNPLGGSVFLELGDESYKKKDYDQAAKYYHRAHIGLGGNIFGGRATLGEGMALAKLGRWEESEAIFAKSAEEKAYPLLIRGQALYFLALSIYGRGDTAKAKNALNQLINSQFPDHWKAKARALLKEIERGQ
jgi:tetratricopeptide (TPR) repeat protein